MSDWLLRNNILCDHDTEAGSKRNRLQITQRDLNVQRCVLTQRWRTRHCHVLETINKVAHHKVFPLLTVMHLLHNDNLMGTPVPITSSPVMVVCLEQLTFLPPLFSSGSCSLWFPLYLSLSLPYVRQDWSIYRGGGGGKGTAIFYFHEGSNESS